MVATSDGGKSTTIWLNKPQDGAEANGARVREVAVATGKAIMHAIALNDYKMVCARYAAQTDHKQRHMQRCVIWELQCRRAMKGAFQQVFIVCAKDQLEDVDLMVLKVASSRSWWQLVECRPMLSSWLIDCVTPRSVGVGSTLQPIFFISSVDTRSIPSRTGQFVSAIRTSSP